MLLSRPGEHTKVFIGLHACAVRGLRRNTQFHKHSSFAHGWSGLMGNLHGKGSHYTSGYTCGTTYIRKHPSLLIFEVQHRVVTISLSLFFSISPSELRTMKNVLFTKASKWQRGCFFFSNFVQCVQFKCGLSEKMVALSAKKKKNSC